MELVALQSILSAEVASASGSLLPPWLPCFQGACVVFASAPSPVLSRVRVHPLLSATSPSEYYRSEPAPHAWCVAPSLGFRSPSRHQQRQSTCERASQVSLYGPPSAFLTPSTACASLCLAGLFHPAATSGIHLSGVCSCCQAAPPRRWPMPSCRFAAESCLRVASPTPSSPAPPSGLRSGQQFETTDRVFSPADASIPS